MLVSTAAMAADEEPICADRPGLATPVCTVAPGTVQIEAGFAEWSHDRSSGVRTDSLTVGDAAVKVGVTDRFHIEFDVTPYARVRTRDAGARATVDGFGDMGVAARYRVTSDDSRVQVALYPFVKIPTAKRPLGNGKVEGGLIVPIDYSLGGPVSLALSPEIDVNADSDGSGRHLAMAQVAGLGFNLSSRISASVEAWGYWDFEPAGTVRQYAVAGSAALLLSNDVQLDAGLNVGLNRNTADVQIYSGIAFRF